MSQIRRTVSLSRELDGALGFLARQREASLSSFVELLLREHPLVHREIETGRMEDKLTDFGLVPSKGSALRASMEGRMKQASASGAGSPRTRRKGAAHP